jgi:hypothetical protein
MNDTQLQPVLRLTGGGGVKTDQLLQSTTGLWCLDRLDGPRGLLAHVDPSLKPV